MEEIIMANPTGSYDLRDAINQLAQIPDQLVTTDTPVDPMAELAGVYRFVGAGGTVKRPTRIGPAMIFNKVKGFDDFKVLIGLLASRKRVAHLFGCKPDKLAFLLKDAVNNPIAPITIAREQAVCQEIVHKATDPDFDIRKLVPAPTNTEEDAGPYITLGMLYASDPETGESDVTIHRMCYQSKDEISIYFVPGRHIDVFREKAEKAGKPLPVSISIGVDPVIEVSACFEPPTTPIGFDELSIAGGIRGRAVELVDCLTVNAKAIANAEVVIEGEILPNVRVAEDQNSHTGKAMPEFPGYTGPANQSLPVIKVKAVTYRKNPIYQTCIGPSEEHVNMAGIPTEASILQMVEAAMPGKLLNVYAHRSGGGKYLAILQFKKSVPADEGKHKQAAILAFAAFSELKHIILVDEDVDIYDTDDVLWAMNTRFQGDIDISTITGVRCHPLDPSQRPEYSPFIRQFGSSAKVIFDCTVPFALKAEFERARFKEVDIKRFLPDFE